MYKNRTLYKGIEELYQMIEESNNVVILTGAGMDTQSNIPDFRSKNGWWKNIDPRTVASIDAFNYNYSLFHEFYSMRINLLQNAEPHDGHYILADFERKGKINRIATQNVAGLHILAGNKNVYELHGNIKAIVCNYCNQTANIEDFLNKRSCSFCGKNALRPNVVLFGEELPNDTWSLAEKNIRECDLLIIIGTSLEVYPVNQLPLIAKGKIVLINDEDVDFMRNFDIKLIGKAKEILRELYKIYNDNGKMRHIKRTVNRTINGYEGICNDSDYWLHQDIMNMGEEDNSKIYKKNKN